MVQCKTCAAVYLVLSVTPLGDIRLPQKNRIRESGEGEVGWWIKHLRNSLYRLTLLIDVVLQNRSLAMVSICESKIEVGTFK